MENFSNQDEKSWKKNSGNIDEKIINYIDSLKIDNKFDKVNHEKYLESISKSNKLAKCTPQFILFLWAK